MSSEPFQPEQAVRVFFGAALATANFDGDSFGDLAVGVLGERSVGAESADGSRALYGAAERLSGRGIRIWHQDRNRVGVKEQGERFS